MTDLTATGLPLDNTADTAAEQYDPAHDYHALNAMLNLYDADGKIQFDKDKAAEREYVTGHVATNSKRFASTAERLEYLISNQYYNPAVFNQYSAEFLDRIYEHVESAGFEFGTFLGAFKFYTSYALKTFDGRLYLEDFPQRCAAVALELAAGNEQQAIEYADEMLAGRFQPATPTFLNLGKAQRGEPVSCFLVRIEDNMESISRGINAALQLSKRGGGVALLLSNLRELGAPIKHIENQSSGVIPVMKLLEDSFSYANQLRRTVRARARCTSTPTTLISCASWIPSERTRTRRSASSRWLLAWWFPEITVRTGQTEGPDGPVQPVRRGARVRQAVRRHLRYRAL